MLGVSMAPQGEAFFMGRSWDTGVLFLWDINGTLALPIFVGRFWGRPKNENEFRLGAVDTPYAPVTCSGSETTVQPPYSPVSVSITPTSI